MIAGSNFLRYSCQGIFKSSQVVGLRDRVLFGVISALLLSAKSTLVTGSHENDLASNTNIFRLFEDVQANRRFQNPSTIMSVDSVHDEIVSYHHCVNPERRAVFKRCQIFSICNHKGDFYYFLSRDGNSTRLGAVNLAGLGDRITYKEEKNPLFYADTRGHFQFSPNLYPFGFNSFVKDRGIAEVIWHHRPAYFLNKHACTNAGHCITENALPLVILMLTFEMQRHSPHAVLDNDILLLEHSAETCGCKSNLHACGGEGKSPTYVKLCRKFVREIIGSLSLNAVKYLSDLKTSALNPAVMECWDKAYGGTGSTGPYTSGHQEQMGPFYALLRDLVHHRYNQYPSAAQRKRYIFCHDEAQYRMNVTLHWKRGKRTITNMDKVMEWTLNHVLSVEGHSTHLASACAGESHPSAFPLRAVRFSVRLVAWENISFAEQIALLAHTDIFISSPGSGSVSGVFLPHGSAMITGPLCEGDDCWNFDIMTIFQHWSHVETVVYKVERHEKREIAGSLFRDVEWEKNKFIALLETAAHSVLFKTLAT